MINNELASASAARHTLQRASPRVWVLARRRTRRATLYPLLARLRVFHELYRKQSGHRQVIDLLDNDQVVEGKA